jgi:D-glycero-alpha-D-manno-heptose-7-phosphate kinase
MLYNKKNIYLRAPMRISFVGGGTDLESYYSQGKNGHVVSAAIDLYTYVFIKDMFDSNTRVHHAEIETEPITSRIKHAYSRVVLEYFGMFKGAEVVITSDIMTTGSGLGASSAMMSALIMGCNEIRNGKQLDKYELADLTYKLECEAGTIGGKQDQFAVVFGGFNSISFAVDGVKVNSIKLESEKLNLLENNLLLIFTNIARESKHIQLNLEANSKSSQKIYLDKLRDLSYNFLNELLSENFSIKILGKILDEAWELKKQVNNKSTNPYIEQLYNILKSKGVIGGKILGAGGGGFFLALTENKSIKEKIKYELYPNFIALDVKFNFKGTEILWKNF